MTKKDGDNKKVGLDCTRYNDVETKVSYGSFKVTTPATPKAFKRGTSAGNGTAPNSMN